MNFLSVDNLKQNINEFSIFMKSKERFDVSTVADTSTVKRIMYTIMKEVSENHNVDLTPLEKLNSQTRDVAKKYFLLNYPQGKTLAYEQQQVRGNGLLITPPENSRYRDPPARLPSDIANRYTPLPGPPQPVIPFEPRKEDVPISLGETEDLLRSLSAEREFASAAANAPPLQDAYYVDNVIKEEPIVASTTLGKRIVYTCINGFDRDARLYPHRSSFRINLPNPIRNVQTCKVSFVQIPSELSSSSPQAHDVYNIPLENMYPYLLLCIDEIRSNYEGSNSVIRRSTSTLTFVRNNYPITSRGYVSMIPGQGEIVTLDTPISTLSSLTVSLLCPNGEPFPAARDDHKISKMNVIIHPEYKYVLEIALDRMVDTNEYDINDKIKINDFSWKKMTGLTNDQSHILNMFFDYVNREEGHVIVGKNVQASGRFKAMSIRLPGSVSRDTGMWVNDSKVEELLTKGIKPGNLDVNPDCMVMNLSLQISVGMFFTTLVPEQKDNTLSVEAIRS